MVVAVLALVVALAGTAGALPGTNSVFSNDIVNKEVKTQDLALGAVKAGRLGADAVRTEKVLDNTLNGTDIDESSLGQVPNAQNAGNANTATTASNALKLGGKLASVFLDGCDVGAVHGFARIAASAGFSAAFTTNGVQVPFNCSGGAVVARRLGVGVYLVRFNGQGSVLATGTVDINGAGGSGADDFVTIRAVNDGGTAFEVQVRDADGGLEDATFYIIVI